MSRFTALLIILLFGTLCVATVTIGIQESVDVPVITQSGKTAGASNITAKVEPTPLNTLNQKLNEREKTITAREQTLKNQEDYFRHNTQPLISNTALMYVILVLFCLLCINFYLDMRRVKRVEADEATAQ